MGEIYIYSDPIKSGKTTKLMQWAASQKNIDGIFQPVIEGKRFLFHISSRTLKALENDTGDDLLTIGQYKFSNQAFVWAQDKLTSAINSSIEWLIIDEIGPLELDGKGLEPAITKILKSKESNNIKIIFVVRLKLLSQVLLHYNIGNGYKKFKVAQK